MIARPTIPTAQDSVSSSRPLFGHYFCQIFHRSEIWQVSTTKIMYSTIVIAGVAFGVGKHKRAILKSDLSLSSTISRQKRHWTQS
jgi:hypothetical protein